MINPKIKWVSTQTNNPAHDQLVLLNCDDGYHIATYNSVKNGFLLKGGAFLTNSDCDLHWVAITPP